MIDEEDCEISFYPRTTVVACCDTEACNSVDRIQPITIARAFALLPLTLIIRQI